ncbi:LuxR C-terminal-related transcriptional regulator [Larkinella bovis]|uniref:LuxR C-terminal-related transcriptional regulator n=1 Tax=Larkinella bovis TaxID=683041 RepID=A0ABW0IFY8_9BACT
MEGEPSYLNVDVKKVFAPSREALTLREKQVLAAMMAGNQSKEIASLLNISKQTVDNTGKIC